MLAARPASPRRGSLRRLGRSPPAMAGLALVTGLAVVAVEAPRIAPGNPFHTLAGRRLSPPSRAHLMGTDQLGRDLFTGVVRGAHTSLTIVAGVVVISSAIGLAVGVAAGFRGGLLDDVAMRVIETVQSVPRFFLAILVAGWFGAGTKPLIVLLGLTSWPFLARVVRAESLSLRERDFVRTARSIGASDARIVLRHIVPNVASTAAAVVALTASRIVLLEAGLAYLGVADPNVPSWGALINNAQQYLQAAWWMAVFPGAALAAAVLGMNLLADGLADVFNRNDGPGLGRPSFHRRWRLTEGADGAAGR